MVSLAVSSAIRSFVFTGICLQNTLVRPWTWRLRTQMWNGDWRDGWIAQLWILCWWFWNSLPCMENSNSLTNRNLRCLNFVVWSVYDFSCFLEINSPLLALLSQLIYCCFRVTINALIIKNLHLAVATNFILLTK